MTAARADPAAAAPDPAGRCAGTPEPAEATTGPPEYGRLRERMGTAVGMALARLDPDADVFEWHPCTGQPNCHALQGVACACAGSPFAAPEVINATLAIVGPELDRLRAMVVALEAECAALTDALAETTHDHRRPPMDMAWAARHANGVTDPCWFCGGMPSTVVHRTPARVREELEER